MSESIQNLFNYLFNPKNPIISSIVFVVFIFAFITIFFKYFVFPLISRFQKEKELLELRNAKLMALFAELEPDPLIRINEIGEIIVTNFAAKKIFKDDNLIGKNIIDLIPNFNLTEQITTQRLIKEIDDKYFLILFRSNKDLGISHLYFRDITEQINNEKKIEEYQIQLKKFSEELQDKIEDEKNQISKTLHDGIGQRLSFLRIKLTNFLDKFCMNENKKELETIISSLEETIAELKYISYDLKPRNLESMGLKMAILQLINDIKSQTGISGDLNFSDDNVRFDEKLEINLFRIVQESLNNIIKYSDATFFGIQFINTNKFVRLIISDNGKGFNPEIVLKRSGLNGGMGLLNIKERVESFGGNLKIDSQSNQGTVLIIEIPLKNLQYELN
ncbi:sensor histidine kinase [Stygiobacter electus]|uniref:Oxygen sensor histidine kinase NreB n=1 Tax=Stygiobacter electus TaxID=3032292 RepID=A0AAE3TCC5_9BACT|nr:ATP-binding protein [Stygiobacter electus]MDF1611326.1 ATP-binding protein [Stygiobacter electus]